MSLVQPASSVGLDVEALVQVRGAVAAGDQLGAVVACPLRMWPSMRSRWAAEITGPTTVSGSSGSPTLSCGASFVSRSTTSS